MEWVSLDLLLCWVMRIRIIFFKPWIVWGIHNSKIVCLAEANNPPTPSPQVSFNTTKQPFQQPKKISKGSTTFCLLIIITQDLKWFKLKSTKASFPWTKCSTRTLLTSKKNSTDFHWWWLKATGEKNLHIDRQCSGFSQPSWRNNDLEVASLTIFQYHGWRKGWFRQSRQSSIQQNLRI